MRKISLILFLVITLSAMATKPDSSQQALEDFVKQVLPTCTFTDGYQCLDVAEDDFLTRDALDKLTPGLYLSAWQAAYDSFNTLPELSIEQRNLKHYRIGFTESPDSYIILFMPLLLPQTIENNQPVGYGTSSFGKAVKFWVDKKTLKVNRHLFYK